MYNALSIVFKDNLKFGIHYKVEEQKNVAKFCVENFLRHTAKYCEKGIRG